MSRHRSLRMAAGVAALLLCFVASAALAGKPLVVVLPFSGDRGSAHVTIRKKLEARHDVLAHEQLSDACQQLGIDLSADDGLLKCTSQVGVTAVVAGKVEAGKLTFALFSGKTADTLVEQSVPYGRRMTPKALAQVIAAIDEGLQRLPSRGRRKTKAPASSDTPSEPPPQSDDTERPGPVQNEESSEPPEHKSSKAERARSRSEGKHSESGKGSREGGLPRVEGTVGLGILMRTFGVAGYFRNANPQYSSGAAFALGGQLTLRPLRFFTTGLGAGLGVGLRLRGTLGLKSAPSNPSTTEAETGELATTIRQFGVTAGYDWKLISDSPSSPYILLSVGYGLMDFKINFGDSNAYIPLVSYSSVPLTAGLRVPVGSGLALQAGFTYHAVVSAGEIEDDKVWFGAAKRKYGLEVLASMDYRYKGFIFGLEYTYTRYACFYDMSENRRDNATYKTAEATIDNYHMVFGNVGYAY